MYQSVYGDQAPSSSPAWSPQLSSVPLSRALAASLPFLQGAPKVFPEVEPALPPWSPQPASPAGNVLGRAMSSPQKWQPQEPTSPTPSRLFSPEVGLVGSSHGLHATAVAGGSGLHLEVAKLRSELDAQQSYSERLAAEV